MSDKGFLKRRILSGKNLGRVRSALQTHKLNTICESARCPNRGECYSSGTATFLILGPVCTRNCLYCSVEKGVPQAIDEKEPEKVAAAAKELGIKHVVITSVTRDDIEDGGAEQFAETVKMIRKIAGDLTVEVLTPDFKGNLDSLKKVLDSGISVFNHNIEAAAGVFEMVRPEGNYNLSLKILEFARWYREKKNHSYLIKSGFMVGLGESFDDIEKTLYDLKGSGVDVVTVGQYFSPTRKHMKPSKIYLPEEFQKIKEISRKVGIAEVYAGPYVRSSYHAAEVKESAERCL